MEDEYGGEPEPPEDGGDDFDGGFDDGYKYEPPPEDPIPDPVEPLPIDTHREV